MLSSVGDDYLTALAGRIESQRAQSASFAQLLANLQGADPVTVVAALDLLAKEDPALEVLRSQASARREVTPRPTPEPVAHPLDFAWHFTRGTARMLAERLRVVSSAGDRILHMGTPTVHAAAVGESDREHVLLDSDARMVAKANTMRPGSAFRRDLLRQDPPEVTAAAVILDPPWYPAEAGAFVNAAARLSRPGASMLLAAPSLLTRPGVEADRAALIEAAAGDGFEFIGIRTGALRYQCPAFERAAFAAAGLSDVPADWRRADLIEFQRTADPPPLSRRVTAERWHAFEIESLPVRIRRDVEPLGDRLLQPIVDGDVLPSVSRRDPARSKVALWTSLNRVFASADPSVLYEVVAAVARGRVDRLTGDELAAGKQLVEVLRAERREHGLAL